MESAAGLVLLAFCLYGAVSFIGGFVGVFRRVKAAATAQADARAAALAASTSSAVAGARADVSLTVNGVGAGPARDDHYVERRDVGAAYLGGADDDRSKLEPGGVGAGSLADGQRVGGALGAGDLLRPGLSDRADVVEVVNDEA